METIRLVYPVEGGDLIEAGEASSKMKQIGRASCRERV